MSMVQKFPPVRGGKNWAIFLLRSAFIYGIVFNKKNKIEVARAMKLREPTGHERSGGNFAESPGQVWTGGGGGEKISVTVRRDISVVALSTV